MLPAVVLHPQQWGYCIVLLYTPEDHQFQGVLKHHILQGDIHSTIEYTGLNSHLKSKSNLKIKANEKLSDFFTMVSYTPL